MFCKRGNKKKTSLGMYTRNLFWSRLQLIITLAKVYVILLLRVVILMSP